MNIDDISSPSGFEVDTVARRLAPEDIRIGMYVAVLAEVRRCWPWEISVEDTLHGRVRPMVVSLPPDRGGKPVRVVEVCLPYVLTESARGKPGTLDARESTLVQVSERYGREAFRRFRERPCDAEKAPGKASG